MNRASDTCGTIRKDSISILSESQRERKKKSKRVFEEIIDEKSHFNKDINLQIQETAIITSKVNSKQKQKQNKNTYHS